MNFLLFAAARRKIKRTNRILPMWAALLVLIGSAKAIEAQQQFTQKQFAQMNVLTRAAFFEPVILQAANEEGVDPNLLWTIAYNETRFRPWLRSPKNARGMMQFIPATADRFDLRNPYEPTTAIRAAARYVKYLSGLFGNRVDSTLAAYNAGEGAVSAFLIGRTVRAGNKTINSAKQKTIGGVPPYAETIEYVGRGLDVYRWLVNRRVFPATANQAVYPTVISGSVARAKFFDSELGIAADGRRNIALQTPVNQTAFKLRAIENALTNARRDAATKTQVSTKAEDLQIYYDARSGSRYLIRGGDKIKLPEAGQIVVTQNVRQQTTATARSSFFAARPPK